MAIKAVVYCSSTGHTKRYAAHFAEKTGLPLYEIKEAKRRIEKGDEIIFFGWIMSGKIQGYENAWKLYETPAVCSVGLYPDTERFRSYMERNNILIDVEYFHLRGGIDPAALKGSSRLLMNAMMRAIKKKIEKNTVADEEREMLAAYENAEDFVDLETLAPVFSWYENRQKDEA